jgi:hypothetical protein
LERFCDYAVRTVLSLRHIYWYVPNWRAWWVNRSAKHSRTCLTCVRSCPDTCLEKVLSCSNACLNAKYGNWSDAAEIARRCIIYSNDMKRAVGVMCEAAMWGCERFSTRTGHIKFDWEFRSHRAFRVTVHPNNWSIAWRDLELLWSMSTPCKQLIYKWKSEKINWGGNARPCVTENPP